MFYDVPNGWPNNTGCFNMGTWNLTDSHIQIPGYVMLWNTWTLNSSCYPESRIRSWTHGPDLLCWWNTWVAAAVAASNQTSQYGPGQLLQYRNHPILRGQLIYRHLPAIYDYLIITMVLCVLYKLNVYIIHRNVQMLQTQNASPSWNQNQTNWVLFEVVAANHQCRTVRMWTTLSGSGRWFQSLRTQAATGDFCLGLRLGLAGWF